MSNDLVIGYVVNNYSSSGQVKIHRFGLDDGADDSMKKWCYYDAGTNNPQVAGIGAAHSLNPGVRVVCHEIGGPDGSIVISGTFGRMGSPQSGPSTSTIGSSAPDQSTSFNDVNTAQSDFPIPLQNPAAKNGERCTCKAPSGQYHKASGGTPFDFSTCNYPNTPYKPQ